MEIFQANTILEFVDVCKSYQTFSKSTTVVADFNLKILEHEFVSVIGHSGCGKSTVLSMAAGLNPITSGFINLNGHPIRRPGLDRGVVFQSANLLPWLTVIENVMLGVNQATPRYTKKERIERCKYYLHKVGLERELDTKAANLSLGTMQRVGIARAFAIKPRILLLDEPFGMLDSMTRTELQDVLLDVWHQEKITALLITHDIEEAIFTSDRMVLMTDGPAAKVGKVLTVPFKRPREREQIFEDPRFSELQDIALEFLNPELKSL